MFCFKIKFERFKNDKGFRESENKEISNSGKCASCKKIFIKM